MRILQSPWDVGTVKEEAGGGGSTIYKNFLVLVGRGGYEKN